MNSFEARLIDLLQDGLAITDRPFADAAARLRTNEQHVIETVRDLLDDGVLSRFGPMFNADALGGAYSLCAMCVPQDDFDHVTALVNAYPEVAHNYAREHVLNMWFVIATESTQRISDVVTGIEHQSGLEVFNFPKEEEYCIGLRFSARRACRFAPPQKDSRMPVTQPSHRAGSQADAYVPDAADRALVALTQSGLSLIAKPFAELGEKLDLSAEQIMNRFRTMLGAGVIRRIGAVPNHYRLGYRANGMSVWNVADDQVSAAGREIAALDFVTHCYRRPRREPRWPYNLFAMVHGVERKEVETKVAEIAGRLGERARAHDVLYSTRILKKNGFRLPTR
ncbi:MAG: siroheme decarboxylase subunit beta [Gammaproteobacteria bacterium]